MAQFVITSPDGQKYRITAPDDATDDQIRQYIQDNLASKGQSGGNVPGADAPASPALPGGDTSPEDARAMIDALPEDQRKDARTKWARSYVQAKRAEAGKTTLGSISQKADDALRAFTHYIPGSSYFDEANAGINSLLGGDYETSLAVERARQGVTEQGDAGIQTPFGEISPSGVLKAGGAIAGGFAAPGVRLLQGVGRMAQAGNAAITGAAYGALQGAGEGEDASERLTNAAIGGAAGGAVGGAVGRVLAGRSAPGAGRAAEEAGQRIGVNLPRVVATDDTMLGGAARSAGGGLGQVPIIGEPIRRGVRKSIERSVAAGERISRSYLQGRSGNPDDVGNRVKDAVADWIRGGSQRAKHDAFRSVERMVPRGARGTMPNTAGVARALAREDDLAASEINSQALGLVREALARNTNGGMTFQGLQQLRTNIGAMIDDGLLPNAGTVKPALKRIYGALTQDIETLLTRNGGEEARTAWRGAVDLSRRIARQQKALTTITGKNEAAVSGPAVLDRILRLAGTKSSADIRKLNQIRATVGPEVMDDIAGAAIHRLGRNQSDEFSMNFFVKNYGALSDRGRNALFGNGGMRRELDDLATVLGRLRGFEAFGNPSGTGRVASVLGGLGAASGGTALNPGATLMSLAGGGTISALMARPAHIRPLRNYLERLMDVTQSGTPRRAAIAGFKGASSALARILASQEGVDRDAASIESDFLSEAGIGGN